MNQIEEQRRCLELKRQGLSNVEIGAELGLNRHQVFRRLQSAEKRARLDPEIADRLAATGVVDLAGLHSGWLIEKDKKGSGQSLYFYLGPDEERISFADAVIAALSEIPKIPMILKEPVEVSAKAYANWIALADLHVGGDYNDPLLEQDFMDAIDHLVSRLPKATHAVMMELGDLLEFNDHKGLTPGSGNHLETKIGMAEHLEGVKTAIRLVRYLLVRLLATHDTVEVHFIKGNHDVTSHIAVMLALAEHFASNPRIRFVITGEEFRVVSWGENAAILHHGDTLSWAELKDVFADQFPEEWAAARAWRAIFTAHFHHDRKKDLIGCTAEHFQTLHRPNLWAKAKGLLSRGSIKAITVHKDRGEEHRTISNIRNTIMGRSA